MMIRKPSRREFHALALGLGASSALGRRPARAAAAVATRDYAFRGPISREVLENYLARAVTVEGLLNGRGDLTDNVRMLKNIGAKFLGRALCLWAGEGSLVSNLERARDQIGRVFEADPEMIVQACIFEIVTTQVDRVPIPAWVFEALEMPVETRNFRYEAMLYPDGKFRDRWRRGSSVPDISQHETQLYFHYQGASYVDLGAEAIHFGQVELMNRNDRDLTHYIQVMKRLRKHAATKARRGLLLCDAHVPSGGLVRDGKLLLDFHSFPLRIKEVSETPLEATLEVGHTDAIYGRSKGGLTPSGWPCEHLPYLVEVDNWGSSKRPGEPRQGGIWTWGYDEIGWFAHLDRDRANAWLRYAHDWVRKTDPNGFLQVPVSRTLHSGVGDRHWYFAQDPNPATPGGFGQESAIKALWASDDGPRP